MSACHWATRTTNSASERREGVVEMKRLTEGALEAVRRAMEESMLEDVGGGVGDLKVLSPSLPKAHRVVPQCFPRFPPNQIECLWQVWASIVYQSASYSPWPQGGHIGAFSVAGDP